MLLEIDLRDPNDPDDDFIPWKYTWGLDLAGQNGQVNSLESAGTIGGLLAMQDMDDPNDPSDPNDATGRFACFYDGNGNLTQLLHLGTWDPNNPAVAIRAHYEYDPYGNVVRQTGSYAATNPWRFSTKQFDAETGLGYWGYRYYSPTLGRWVSRDRIGERGGPNLYVYARNSSMSAHDPVGLNPCRDAKAKGTWDGKGGCNVCDGQGGFAVCINACARIMNLTSPLPFQCERTILPSEACPPPPDVPRDVRCSMEEKKFCVALEMRCTCEGERAHRTSDFSCVGRGSGDLPTVQIPQAPPGFDEEAYANTYALCMKIRSEKQSAEKRAECYEQRGGGLPCAKTAADDQRQAAATLGEGLEACARRGIQLPP